MARIITIKDFKLTKHLAYDNKFVGYRLKRKLILNLFWLVPISYWVPVYFGKEEMTYSHYDLLRFIENEIKKNNSHISLTKNISLDIEEFKAKYKI